MTANHICNALNIKGRSCTDLKIHKTKTLQHSVLWWMHQVEYTIMKFVK